MTTIGGCSAWSEYAVIIAFLSTLIVQAISTYMQYNMRRRIHKINATAELHKEFNSDSMSTHRAIADRLTAKFPTILVDDIAAKLALSKSNKKDAEKEAIEQVRSIYMILRFYQRVSVMMRDGALRSNTIFDLFGETFLWWHTVYLSEGFKHWETASADIDWFEQWLEQHARSKHSPWKFWKWNRRAEETDLKVQKLAKWREKAKIELEKRLNEQSPPP